MTAPTKKKAWTPKCAIHSTRGWDGKSFGQECALHGPFNSAHQRHGQYGIACPIAERANKVLK